LDSFKSLIIFEISHKLTTIMKIIIILKSSLILLIITTGFTTQLFCQIGSSNWVIHQDKEKLSSKHKLKVENLYSHCKTATISTTQFETALKSKNQEVIIPTPDGNFETFEINPVQVVADEVAHLYTIKTFRGYKKGDPTKQIACDISKGGFHAAIFGNENTYFIEPINSAKPNDLVVFYHKDKKDAKIQCHFDKIKQDIDVQRSTQPSSIIAPSGKSVFRLALVAAGEYSQQFGGSPYSATNVLNALASGVNILNPIYLRDLGIELTLVTTTDLVFEDPATDPFDPNNINSMLNNNQSSCDSALGNSGYDVGHLVIWGNFGGVGALGSFCYDPYKANGFSGNNNSITTLWVDYIAHELGHQFGSEHNFAASCGGNSVFGYRYEPGEGSSIMCYANVCGASNQYVAGSDPFFHYGSIVQIQSYINAYSCVTSNSAGNSSDPVSDAKNNITIPRGTPFILVGSATDASDATGNLTYNWEQYDGSGPAASGSPDCSSTTAPMFRYRPPVSQNYRSFPRYDYVLSANNNNVIWETLPCVARNMNFSMAVRDNNTSFGRVTHDQMVVTVANTGPFEVTAPNGGENLTGSATVTWNVNGTDSHCPNVDILLSLDGGATYSVVANGTANDGAQSINIFTSSTNARILIQCSVSGGFSSASTFYDTGDGDFTIIGGVACYTDLTHSNGLSTNETGMADYESSTYIKTTLNTTLQNGSKVDYDATTDISINGIFTVNPGAEFSALIDGCNNGAGGSNFVREEGQTSNSKVIFEKVIFKSSLPSSSEKNKQPSQ